MVYLAISIAAFGGLTLGFILGAKSAGIAFFIALSSQQNVSPQIKKLRNLIHECMAKNKENDGKVH